LSPTYMKCIGYADYRCKFGNENVCIIKGFKTIKTNKLIYVWRYLWERYDFFVLVLHAMYCNCLLWNPSNLWVFIMMHTLVYWFALFYLGVISIETVMIVRNKDETIFDVIVRTACGFAKYITINIKTNE